MGYFFNISLLKRLDNKVSVSADSPENLLLPIQIGTDSADTLKK